MIKKLFIFLIFVLFFLIFSVSAETGTITVSNISTNTYYNAAGVGTATGFMNYSIIYWNTSAFNKIEDFKIRTTIAGSTFGHSFNSTPFTIISNGTGGGFFYYDANTTSVYYVFDSDSTFTASPIRISMSTNITNDFSLRCSVGFQVAAGSSPPTVSEPVYIHVNDSVTPGNKYARCGAIGEGYTTVSSAVETGTYNVTYYNIGAQTIFVGNVTKGGIVNSSYKWQSATYTYASETTFNKNPFYYDSAPYHDGLYLNVSLPTGDYTRQLVNSSGAGLSGIGTTGSSSGQISYSASSIAVGKSYGINTSISDTNFSSSRTYYIYAYDISNNLITGFPIETTSQTYASGKFWSFNNAGTYNAVLKYCDNLVFTCTVFGINRIEIDTAWAYVPVPTYNYSITTDKNSYVPGDTVIFTINNPSPVKVYFDVFENTIDTGLGVPTFGLNTEIAAGASVSISKLIPDSMKLGNYTAYLVSAPLTSETVNVLTSKAFNISSPSSASNTVFIGWDRDSYTLGDTGKLTTVSDYNSTIVYVLSPGGSNRTYLFPSNSTNITMIGMDYVGKWVAKLINNSGIVTYANTTVFAGAPIGNETFANCQFSQDFVCWDHSQYEQGDVFRIDYQLTPGLYTISTAFVQISSPSGNVILTEYINFSTISPLYTGSVIGSFTPQATNGIYISKLIITDIFGTNYTKASAATTVIARQAVPTPTTDIETGTNDLLAGNFITIILVMIAFAGIGLELGGFFGSLLGFSSGFIVLSVLGLMPTWALFLFAIIAITAFAVVAGKQFSGGGND